MAQLAKTGYDNVELAALCDIGQDNAELAADEAERLLGRRPAVFADLETMVRESVDLAGVDVVTAPPTRSRGAMPPAITRSRRPARHRGGQDYCAHSVEVEFDLQRGQTIAADLAGLAPAG